MHSPRKFSENETKNPQRYTSFFKFAVTIDRLSSNKKNQQRAALPLENDSETSHLTLESFASGEETSRKTGGNLTGWKLNEGYSDMADVKPVKIPQMLSQEKYIILHK